MGNVAGSQCATPKCCQPEGGREADVRAYAEERSLVTVADHMMRQLSERSDQHSKWLAELEQGSDNALEAGDEHSAWLARLEAGSNMSSAHVARSGNAKPHVVQDDRNTQSEVEPNKAVENNVLGSQQKKAAVKKAASKKIASAKAKAKTENELLQQADEATAALPRKTVPVKVVQDGGATGELQKSKAPPPKRLPQTAQEREAAWQALPAEDKLIRAGEFIQAVREENYELVNQLMKQGVKADARDEKGETALYLAAKSGSIDSMEFLVSTCGSNINCTTKKNETALFAACKNDQKGAMEWLLTRGINVHAKNKRGEVAASVATGETAKSEILEFKMRSRSFR